MKEAMSAKEIVLRVLFWALFILGCILLVWYIIGDSPLTEQIFVAFISAFMLLMYVDNSKIKGGLFRLERRLDKLESRVAGMEVKE